MKKKINKLKQKKCNKLCVATVIATDCGAWLQVPQRTVATLLLTAVLTADRKKRVKYNNGQSEHIHTYVD